MYREGVQRRRIVDRTAKDLRILIYYIHKCVIVLYNELRTDITLLLCISLSGRVYIIVSLTVFLAVAYVLSNHAMR